MTESTARSRRSGPLLAHRPGLDGVRALAVLAVLGYHLELAGFDGGSLGVEVFFTLSGYLVTALLLTEMRRSGRVDLRRFALARARRLVPALLVCLIGTTAAVALFDPTELGGLGRPVLASLGYVQNWYLVLTDVPYGAAFEDPSPLLHLWSLAVEGQLYLIWPLVLTWCVARGRRRTVAIILMLAALSALATAVLFDPDSPYRVYYGTDTRSAGFLIGAALAAIVVTRPAAERRTAGSAGLDTLGTAALFALVGAVAVVTEFDERLYRQGGLAAVGLLTAGVIAAAGHPATWLGRGLGAAPLAWLGQRSYGIYLYHWPIFVLSEPLAGAGFPVMVDIGRVSVTLLVAAASHRWVELPIRRGMWPGRSGGRSTEPLLRRRPGDLLFSTAAATVAVTMGAAVISVVALVEAEPPGSSEMVSSSASAAGPLAAPPAPAEPSAPAAATPEASPADASTSVLVVGDSVVLGSADAIRAAVGPSTVIDGVVGRQFTEAPAIVAAWAARHPGPIVVHLGSNGTIRDADIEGVMTAAGDRPVVLVNVAVPRRWQKPDNAALAAAAARHAERVTLVDWAAVVARDPNLLGRDHVHPVPAGRTALASAVSAALGK